MEEEIKQEKTMEQRVGELEQMVHQLDVNLCREQIRLSAYITAFINSNLITIEDVERISGVVEQRLQDVPGINNGGLKV